MKLYQYPNCSTCRRAVAFLRDKQVEVEIIDIVATPPSKGELNQMLAAMDGQIRKLFNTSGVQYRELDMKTRLPQMSDDDAIDLLAGSGKLIKRPFLLSASAGVVGFKEEVWNEFLSN